MTITFKRWHCVLFLVLLATQLGGYVLLARSSADIFTADFLQRAGWFARFMIPFCIAFSVAFTDTAIIAKFTEAFTKAERREPQM